MLRIMHLTCGRPHHPHHVLTTHTCSPQLLLQGTLGDYANSMFSKPLVEKGHWKNISGGLVFVGNTAAEVGRI